LFCSPFAIFSANSFGLLFVLLSYLLGAFQVALALRGCFVEVSLSPILLEPPIRFSLPPILELQQLFALHFRMLSWGATVLVAIEFGATPGRGDDGEEGLLLLVTRASLLVVFVTGGTDAFKTMRPVSQPAWTVGYAGGSPLKADGVILRVSGLLAGQKSTVRTLHLFFRHVRSPVSGMLSLCSSNGSASGISELRPGAPVHLATRLGDRNVTRRVSALRIAQATPAATHFVGRAVREKEVLICCV
jgi:hypothetical protein